MKIRTSDHYKPGIGNAGGNRPGGRVDPAASRV
jgi:hypothetical protein